MRESDNKLINKAIPVISFLVLFCMTFILVISPVFAADDGAESDSDLGQIYYYDDAELITDSDKVKEAMTDCAKYTNVAFLTCYSDLYEQRDVYEEVYSSIFGDSDGVILVVDMNTRKIILCAHGEPERYITSAVGDSITDNVHLYATNEDYDTMAIEAFYETADALADLKVPMPMKYATGAFISVCLGMFLAYLVVVQKTRVVVKNGPAAGPDVTRLNMAVSTRFLKHVHVEASSGSSGGGSSGGGGGGGSSSGGSSSF